MRVRLVLVAVVLALAGGFLGAAAGSRLSWEFAPSLPAGTESDALKSLVFPGLQVWGGGDAELFLPQGDGEGIQYGYADYWVKHTAATRDLRPYTEGVRDRLAAAGWEIRSDLVVDDAPDAVTESHTISFWAERDGLMLAFSDFHWPDRPSYDSDGAAMFQLYRSEPAVVTAATWAGAALGGALAVLLGWWVRRRIHGHSGRVLLVGVLTPIALVCLLPAVLFSGGTLPDGPPIEPWWMGLVYLGMGPALLSGVLALVVLAVAAGPVRGHPRVAVLALVVILAGVGAVGWFRSAPRSAALGATVCRPSGPPAEPPAADTRLSRDTYVYVTQESTPDQRNLIDAAIFRVTGAGVGQFTYDPLAPEFRQAYCGRSPLDAEVGRTLPYIFAVGLSSPGAFPALVAELQGMPGVVAVRHALPD